jgi:archaellum component FlaF (FlaF/FlaG flagellin family)
MGLSVSIASAIVLIGWIAFIGSISAAMLTTINAVGTVVNSTSSDDIKLSVQLALTILYAYNSNITISVQNTGSREIFLRNETFAWNSVILTYNDTDWQTYLIDNYTVLAINPVGANTSFTLTSQQSINPGEQALIEVDLPSGAPPILLGSIVNVVFASQYGVSAAQEILVSAYGQQTSISEGGQGISGPDGYTTGGGTV